MSEPTLPPDGPAGPDAAPRFALALCARGPSAALQAVVRPLLKLEADLLQVLLVDLRAQPTEPLLPNELRDHPSLHTILAPGRSEAAGLSRAIEVCHADHVILRADLGAPPADLAAVLRRLPLGRRGLLLGRALPPAGIAQSAIDVLMLHLLPHDAAADAPLRWPAVPGAVPVALPAELLRRAEAFDPAEPDAELAIQAAALRLSELGCPIEREPAFSWSVPRRSAPALAAAVRAHAAARVQRLDRDPEGPLEGGWALASRPGLARALEADPLGQAAEQLVEQLGQADPSAMMHLGPDWERLARELLRRLVGLMPRAASRWALQGIEAGLSACGAESVPLLLARAPISPAGRDAALLPVDRPRVDLVEAALCRALPRCGPEGALIIAMSAEALHELQLRHPLRLRSWQLLAALRAVELSIVPLNGAPTAIVRLVAGALVVLQSPSLQGESWGLVCRALGSDTDALGMLSPLDVQSARPVRLLAAPPWAEPLALELFLAEVLGPLLRQADVSINLLHDADRDGSAADARGALRAALQALAPVDGVQVEAQVLSLRFLPEALSRLGGQSHALVGPAPEALAAALGAPLSPVESALARWETTGHLA